MKAVLLGTLVLVAACAPKEVPAATVTRDPEIEGYAQQFEREVGVSTQGITLRFVGVMTQAGHCYISPGRPNEVVLNRQYWEPLPRAYRETLVYHELGHCALGRSHKTERTGTRPASIMHPSNFGDPCFNGDRAGYVQELKSGR